MRKEQIIKILHKIVRDDPFVNEMAGSIGTKLDDMDNQVTMYKQQIDIQQAIWAIPLYERELGLTTNVSKSLADRRALILAKMRGSGKIGAEEIKVYADSWTNGDVEVYFSPTTITIKFTSIVGLPPSINELVDNLKTVVPAHLKIAYELMYLLISDVQGMTIEEMESTTLDKFAGGVYRV